MQPCIPFLIALFPTFTSQTYNNNLFDFPGSLIELVTTQHLTNQYQYPNGTPVNMGASSSFDPLENLTIAPGYRVRPFAAAAITIYVPVLWTATIFEAFYLTIFEHAAAEFWRDGRPTKQLVVSIGQLQLSFNANGVPLSWNIIAAFAWNMWQAAKRGFTAGYTLEIESPDGGKTMVTLRARSQPVVRDTVHQEYVEPEPDPDSCDCSMTEFEDLTTDDNMDETLDDYIDDFCKRHCRRRERRRKLKRRGGRLIK